MLVEGTIGTKNKVIDIFRKYEERIIEKANNEIKSHKFMKIIQGGYISCITDSYDSNDNLIIHDVYSFDLSEPDNVKKSIEYNVNIDGRDMYLNINFEFGEHNKEIYIDGDSKSYNIRAEITEDNSIEIGHTILNIMSDCCAN